MGRWSFVLTDYAFNPLGEILNAGSRQIVLPLNGLPTCSFQMDIRNVLAPAVLDMTTYVKAYRLDNAGVKRLEFYGPVVSAEEQIQESGKTIAVNAAGVGWFLAKRLAGKSSTGTAFANTDRAMIIKALIDTANADGYPVGGVPVAGDTNISTAVIVNEPSPYVPPGSGGSGITTGGGGTKTVTPTTGGGTYSTSSVSGRPSSGAGTPDISAASAVNYTAGPYKTILDCISELSAGVDGFDWQIVPFDNFSGGIVGSGKIGQFRAYPIIGSRRTDAVFEYGDGRNNVQDYSRTISRDVQANRVYHNASAGPDAPGYPTVSALDSSSIDIWRVMEDLASADLADLGLRQSLVNEHVRIRATPRQVASFTPALTDPEHPNRVPQYRDNWIIGDQVRARIVASRTLRFDAWMRVYGATFDVDNNGMERVALTLAQE